MTQVRPESPETVSRVAWLVFERSEGVISDRLYCLVYRQHPRGVPRTLFWRAVCRNPFSYVACLLLVNCKLGSPRLTIAFLSIA
jgi:hypothetical protein